MVASAPRRLAIWDPAALGPDATARLHRALNDPAWPYDAVQFRLRDAAPLPAELAALAAAVRDAGRALWINRDLRRAQTLGAVGLHVGAAEAAAAAGPARAAGLALGLSVHDVNEAADAARRAPAFLLFGHVYETPSKAGAPGRGLDALRAAVTAAGTVPVLAVGGVDATREAAVFGAGAAGVAAIRAAFR